MKNLTITAVAVLICFIASAAFADHAYIKYDAQENMVISGPFDLIIPKPLGTRIAGPEHSTPSFLNEEMKVSEAGFFANDQFIMVQIETTNAPAGTLSNKNLPVRELAGEEFRVRSGCIDISQEELDTNNDPMFEFIEEQKVQIVPAVLAMQLFVTNDEGTGEGIVLYMRNVPGGCDAVSPDFEAEFNDAFERFIASVRNANK